MTPKRPGALPRGDELGALGRPPPGGRMPPRVRPSLRHLLRFTSCTPRGRGGAGPRSSARSRRKDCLRQSRSISAGFAVDEPNAMRSSYRRGARPAGPRSSQRWRRFADRRRGKASLHRRGDAAAKFFLVRGSRNLFLLSARGHEAIMTAREEAKETKRS